jgi:uncharacterized membrane protein YdjX (TVP38/TMEM64 family)
LVTVGHQQPDISHGSTARPLQLRRVLPIAIVITAMAVILLGGWHRHLSFETLVSNRAAIDDFVHGHCPVALLAFLALYVTVVALSIPGAVILTVAGGVLFGWIVATVAVIAGGTVGATLIFLVARTACGEAVVRRAGPRLGRMAAGIKADAFSYLLFLRLMPVIPFWLVNIVPAVVGVKLRTFVGATAIGIIPATVTFTLVGAGLDSVIRREGAAYRQCLASGWPDCRLHFGLHAVLTPQVLAALAALGALALIPLILKRRRIRNGAGASIEQSRAAKNLP